MGESVSFRQVGKEITGKVYKGPVIDAYNRYTQSSIPSKKEQILSPVTKKAGFGTTQERNIWNSKKNSPGPGDYLNESAQENPSVSKKGFGSLHNRSNRFRRAQVINRNPGPGSYDFTMSKTVPGFAKVSQLRVDSFTNKNIAPPPGHYNPKPATSETSFYSCFKSQSKRSSETKNENPAPWHYSPTKPLAKNHYPSPAFAQPARAKRHQVNLYNPHEGVPAETSPGPGDYYCEPSFDTKKHNLSFIKGDSDRFGNKLRPRVVSNSTPGPGAYYKQALDPEVHQVAGAVFMSESERVWLKTENKPPGPAFYKPVPVARKKNFHLNSNNLWV